MYRIGLHKQKLENTYLTLRGIYEWSVSSCFAATTNVGSL
jgi:hypothetical protein